VDTGAHFSLLLRQGSAPLGEKLSINPGAGDGAAGCSLAGASGAAAGVGVGDSAAGAALGLSPLQMLLRLLWCGA